MNLLNQAVEISIIGVKFEKIDFFHIHTCTTLQYTHYHDFHLYTTEKIMYRLIKLLLLNNILHCLFCINIFFIYIDTHIFIFKANIKNTAKLRM